MSSYLPVLSYAPTGRLASSSSDVGAGASIASASTSADSTSNPPDGDSGAASVLRKSRRSTGKSKVRLATGKTVRGRSSEALAADKGTLGSISADDVVERDLQADTLRSTKRSYAEAVRTVKKVVVAVQLALLEGVGTEAQLQSARPLLTQAEYGDVVTERAIVNRCGLPTCPNVLPEFQERKGRYRISLREHKVYDLQETSLFCSPDCLIRSSTFSATLKAERDVLVSKEQLIRIVKAVRGLGLSGAQKHVKRTVILERQEEMVQLPSSFGPSDAIEGYIPQKSCHPDPADGAVISGDLLEQIQETTAIVPLENRGSDAVDNTGEHQSGMEVDQEEGTLGTKEPCRHNVFSAPPDNNLEQLRNLSGVPNHSEVDLSPVESRSEGKMYDSTASTSEFEQPGMDTRETINSTVQENPFDFRKFDEVLRTVETGLNSQTVAELDDYEATDSWYDEPPAGFKVELSPFGKIWQALDEWICGAAVAHVYGKEFSEEENFLEVNGREYMRRKVATEGLSAEIARTVATCLAQQLPHVAMALRISVPTSTLEQALGRLVQSMTFLHALPPFGMKQWRMLATLFLDALSVQRLPLLSTQLGNNKALVRQVVESAGISEAEYTVFREILLPAGRLPTFSTQSGG